MTAFQIYAESNEKSPSVISRSVFKGISASEGKNGIADNVTPNHPCTRAPAATLPFALFTIQVNTIVNGNNKQQLGTQTEAK